MNPKRLPSLLLLLSLTSLLAAEDEFRFQGDSLSSVLTPGQEKTTLRGNAQIVTGSLVIKADEIELSGKNFRYAQCRGSVLVKDVERKLTITADKMDYDRVKKISRLQGICEMLDAKNELIVRSGYFEYHEVDEKIEMQIGVRIFRKDLTCRSENAVYDRKLETLQLSGLPQVFKKSDEYKAGHIQVNLKTEEILLDGKVSGSITPENKKKPTPAPQPTEGAGTHSEPAPAFEATPEAVSKSPAPTEPSRP